MKYVLAILLLSGCATLSETALPRASNALDGLKSFYLAMCMVPPSGKEQLCEKAKDDINVAIDFYTKVNDAVGSDE